MASKSAYKDKDEYIASKDPYYGKQQEIKSGAPVSKPVAETAASTSPLAPLTTPANTGYSAVTSAGGTVNYTTPEAINFIENATPGSYMTGGNGTTWYKDPQTGVTTVTGADGVTASVNGNKVPIQQKATTVSQQFSDMMAMLGGSDSPAYQGSQWDNPSNQLLKAAIDMNYGDWVNGSQYAALAGRYSDLGRQAMQNTLGQVSARTGGLASSYAGSVAQQAYNDYMTRLQDAALNMYNNERDQAVQNAQLATSAADRDYNRYLDELSQFNINRNFASDILARAQNQVNYQNEWNYNVGRDAIADERYNQQWDYNVAQDTLANDWKERQWDYQLQQDEQTRNEALAKLMAGIGDYSRFKELGLTDEEIQALQNAYWQMQMSGSGSGGGGGSGRGSGGGDSSTGDGVDWSDAIEYAKTNGIEASKKWVYQHPELFGFKAKSKAQFEWEEYLRNNSIYADSAKQRGQGRSGSNSSSSGKNNNYIPNASSADNAFGTSYTGALAGVKAMQANGASDDELVAALKRYNGTQLTDSGMRNILKILGF